jgi:hypothetical protein
MANSPKAQRLKALATYRLLAAQARSVLGTTKLTTTAINAMAKTAAMAAIGKADTFSASIRASLLVAGAVTGKFFTLLNIEDRLTASEIRNFNMAKVRHDEIQAVDRALAEVRKALADTAHTTDQATRGVSKARTDTSITSDAVLRRTGKARADTFAAHDVASKGLASTKSDTASLADIVEASTGKSIGDSSVTTDLLSRTVAFVRVFSDSADATDAINASLLTDDGEVIYLEKVVLDSVAASTYLSFSMSQAQADAATTTDDATLASVKAISDTASTTSAVYLGVMPAYTDEVNSSEVVIRGVETLRQDRVSPSDFVARNFEKSIFDSVTVADARSFFFEAYYETGVTTSEVFDLIRIAANGVPPQTDNQTASDEAVLGSSKPFTEALGAGDAQTASFGKNMVENLPVTELRTVALQRTLQESASAGDSGLLAMTDYCDSTYFSQAYVGTERIFS